MTTLAPMKRAVLEELHVMQSRHRPRQLRTMEQFAEDEIIIPDGPFANHRYRLDRQPIVRHFFREVDSGRWTRFAGTGPQQSGKTLNFYVIPTMYHLFELQETVICGLPTMDIARDKWEIDLLPAIAASRYRDMLPTKGTGSRGATRPELITFRNGARLKFMSGGGGDEKRSAFTSRVLVATEVDKLDEAGGTSREADKLRQMEGRTRAYKSRARIYLECTVSTEDGRIWQEVQNGTNSQILIPCHSCGDYVLPERDQFVGWQEHVDEWDAEENARFSCPNCGILWTEEQRAESNAQSVLLHKGQELTETGEVVGPLPRTKTLGFRYTAVHNTFVEAGTIGVEEWRAKRAVDPDGSDKALCQWVWAVPPKPLADDLVFVDIETLIDRQHDEPRGHIPNDADVVTCGVDIGKHHIHWTAIAWGKRARGYILDYQDVSVPVERFGVDRAIQFALSEIREHFEEGFIVGGSRLTPARVLVDARYLPDVIYDWLRDGRNTATHRDKWLPAMGHGKGQDYGSTLYKPPAKKGGATIHVDAHYYVTRDTKARAAVVHVDANFWKTWLHRKLVDPDTAPTKVTLFKDNRETHRQFAQHITSEKQVEKTNDKGGVELVWERIRKANHWLDTTSLACVAAHVAGVRQASEQKISRRTRPKNSPKPSPFVSRAR